MKAEELQQRNEKADQLRVLQTDDGKYFVESGEGKLFYNVTISDSGDHCCCGDYTKNIKRDPDFRCKHILAVLDPPCGLPREVFCLKRQCFAAS